MRMWTAVFGALALTTLASAEVRPHPLFASNCVLQQNAPVPVWGWADPGEKITITAPWLAEPARVEADGMGRWKATLNTPHADGKPFTLTIAGTNSITLSNVLLGEVWLCSGQSNMEWPLKATENADAAIREATFPQIRLFNVNNRIAVRPEERVDSGGWKECTPESAAGFSAVAQYFARDLTRALNVPIGLIQSDWGGTIAEAWTSAETLAEFPEYAESLAYLKAMDPDPNVRAKQAEKFASRWWDNLDTARGAPGANWSSSEFNDGAWAKAKVPANFSGELGGFDGVVYHRVEVTLPETVAGKAGSLSLGPIDDRDDAYVNGVHVGGMRDDGQWNTPRTYAVPAGVLKAGTNVIAVRVLDTAGPGGIFGDAALMKLTSGEVSVPLAGEWRVAKGPAIGALPPIGQGMSLGPNTPTALYNAMIKPLAPYRIAGAIWYQGESNRGNATVYERLFPAMIADWRRTWGQGEFPFYFTQIAPFNYGNDRGQTADLREAQRRSMSTPNTGMAVTMDIGNASDIHPANKKDVGARLARWALAKTYGKPVVFSGPLFVSASFADGAADVTFDLCGSKGLASRGGAPTHFAVAGDDRVFHAANAEIVAPNRVRATSEKVARPVAVRYAYENSPEPNLFNAENLPASPFRSDTWERPEGGWAPAHDMGRTGFLTNDRDFRPLFDGRTLTGWVNVNTAPGTWRAEDGMIRCTGKPTGVLRTDRMYENFEMELEWRHLEAQGNAGLFVWSDPITARGVPFTRSVEVQVMVGSEADWYTSDGDIFPIHGAKMTPLNPRPNGGSRSYPTEKRMKPSPEWNHYKVVCNNGEISLAVNGKVVTQGKDISPRKGFICLESEGTPIDFRNVLIRELPPSTASLAPEHVASNEDGFVPLYTGVDFAGWKFETEHEGHFKSEDWKITCDGHGKDLWTSRSFKDFVLIADWRFPAKPTEADRPVILPDGSEKKGDDGKTEMVRVKDAGDSGIYLRGSSKSQVNCWCWPIGSGEVYGYRTDNAMPADVRAGVTPKVRADAPPGQWNRFVITMKGDRLTVVLNGVTVIENAHLPGVAPEGPIALQVHESPIEWANILIKELK